MLMSIKKTDILTFVGGLVFFSVVVGVIISKNDKIRSEIEGQAEGFLGVGRNALQQLESIITRISKITGEQKIANKNSTIENQDSSALPDDYDTLWQAVETQKL
jgi:hypothetical protein